MKGPRMIGRLALGAAAIVLVASCGSGGTDGSGSATTIDLASVESGIAQVSSVFPVCRTGAGVRGAASIHPVIGRTAWLTRFLQLRRNASLRLEGSRQALFPPTKPGDVFGDCGGKVTYPSYSHSNGTTTATLEFDNFCNINSETGAHDISDGRISFVDHGTPSAGGPITSSLEADSPNGVTFLSQTAGGAQLSSQKTTFTGFDYDVGVPGGDPTASNPDRVTLEDARVSDLESGKTYRQSNYNASTFVTASGGTQATISGRGYRSNGDYFDFNTTSPLVLNSNGDITSGQVTFTGGGGTTAVLTLVPGTVFQATMTVNGTPVTNVPACR